MPGFLLVDDAIEARKNLFDEWLGDRQRDAQQAAQDAAQRAQQAVQEQLAQRQAQAEQAQQSFDQRAQDLRSYLDSYTPAEPTTPPPATPEAQDRSRQFEDWLNYTGGAVGGFTAPIGGVLEQLSQSAPGRFVGGVAEAAEEQRQRHLERADILARVQQVGEAARRGDLGATTQLATELGMGVVGPLTGAEADVSPLVSRGLERAGVPQPAAQVLGQAANLAIPVAGIESRAARLPAQAEAEAVRAAPGLVGARIGGAVAGGIAGNVTTPEDADPLSRAAHIGAGAAIGATTPGLVSAALRGEPAGLAGQLDTLRPYGPAEGPVLNPSGVEKFTTYTTENLLSGPATHLWNIITQAVELARQPVVRALGGREDEAYSGLRAAASAVPDAIGAFTQTLQSGRSQAGGRVGQTSAWNPFLRLLGASDDFFKIVGSQMGRGMEARAVLREAGDPTDAAAITNLLQTNAERILASGDRASRLSVFGEGTSGVGHWLSETTQRLLRSDNRGDQVVGLLMKAIVPFSGVPERLWQIGVSRAPGVAEVNQLRKLGYAVKAGDEPAIRAAVGELAAGSVLNLAILAQVANGNVTGPDDPEHPNSVRVGGTWYDYSGWGPMALQFGIPASIVESVHRTGNLPDHEVLDYAHNALDASLKTIVRANFLSNALDLAGALTSADPISGVGRIATGYVDRLVPKGSLLNQMEQALDEHMRDVPRGDVVAREMSRIPGLAGLLPMKISPTTGEPQLRQRAGPLGVLLRAETVESDPLRQELARLERLGYTDLPNYDRPPDTVTWRGTEIKLRPAEQRAITAALGKVRALTTSVLQDQAYQRSSDDVKAHWLNTRLAQVDQLKTQAWLQQVDPNDARRRLAASQRVVGRLVNPSPDALEEAVAPRGGGQAAAAGLPARTPIRERGAPAAAPPRAPAPAPSADRLAEMRAYLDSILGQSSAALLQRLTQAQRDELAATLVAEERRAQQQAERPAANR